jgi:ribulose-5-phosphate 4-epimerase/fuculose-1-phosphate aldolase
VNGDFGHGRQKGAADELAMFSRELYERGWTPGTAGDLSVRQPAGPAAITGRPGRDKGTLTRQDAPTGTESESPAVPTVA